MKEKIAKAKKNVKLVDKLRIILLCVAVPFLVFIYFGQKIWGEAAWFASATSFTYIILSYLILGIVITTIGKYILIAYHNSLVKKI